MSTFGFAGSSLLELPGNGARTPGTRVPPGINLIRLHEDLWRVTRPDGNILGYIEVFTDPRGRRYRSKRLIPLKKWFVVLGEFWSFDDATDCLRFG